MSGWILAIDVGTTSTAAARRVGDRVDMILLQGAPRMPSAVFWREATETGTPGRIVIGTEADQLAGLAPWCLERTPKARLGEEFIQLGDKQVRPVELISEIIREVYDEALQLRGGEPPTEVRLTHPARWRESRLDRLVEAAKLAGIENPVLVPEPVAAAIHFASERLKDGEYVAVYDLGGGTLDTAVLRRVGGSFEVIGRTGGNEEIGGEDFDDDVFRFLGDQLDGDAWKQIRTADERRDRTWGQAGRDFRRQARVAKERLSRNPEYDFYAPPPLDQELQITAEEFEQRITPTMKGTISELERTILAAGIQVSDLSAIYLAGGSSRIPLVARLIREELGITPQYLDDPKAVIALGAARMGSEAAERTQIVSDALEEETIPRPGDEDATKPGQPDRTVPGGAVLPPPPPPPPPKDPASGGASNRADADSGGATKKSNRGKIIGGVLAAVVVLGGVGAAILLTSGGGSDDTSVEEPTFGSQRLGGTVTGGSKIEVRTNNKGLPKLIRVAWKAPCGANTTDLQTSTITTPFDERTPGGGFANEGHYSVELDDGRTGRYTVKIDGAREEDGQFRGNFEASSSYIMPTLNCTTGPQTWETSDTADPNFKRFVNP